MLDGLRVASQNWLGRGFMAAMLLAMIAGLAILGVSDVFRGFSSRRLVKVGSGEITIDAYRYAYQTELRRLQERLRRAITNEEARRAGLDQQVLDRLITDATLDQRAKSLGLAIGDDDVQRQLRAEKVFHGPSGEFDPARFRDIIANAGFTERSFLVDQRGAYLRKEIADALVYGIEPPRLMLEAIHRFRGETRTLEAFLLPVSALQGVAAPSAEEVKKFYQEHEYAFRAREYRKLNILAATPTTLARPDEVSDDEVRKRFDEVKDRRYGKAEKRDVKQMVFQSDAEAREALARLKGGLSFDALAAERKLNPKDVNLGVVSAADFGDPKVAAAVFAPKEPGFAEIVSTPFGRIISQVLRIEPGVLTKTYEQAAPELRAEIAAAKAGPRLAPLRDKIEDQRAAGKTLAETAEAVGLKTREIDFVDELGVDKSGKSVLAEIPGGAELLKAAFASDKGVDNEAVASRDGGHVWFDVTEIEQSRAKTFDEVKGDVEAAIRRDAERQALSAKAEELVGALRAGKPIDNLAGELGLPLREIKDMKRADRADYTPATILQFFEVPVKGAGATPVDGGQLIFYVASAITPPFEPESAATRAVAQQLRPALANDLLEQYVGGLEKALNVDINQKALQAAVGGDNER